MTAPDEYYAIADAIEDAIATGQDPVQAALDVGAGLPAEMVATYFAGAADALADPDQLPGWLADVRARLDA